MVHVGLRVQGLTRRKGHSIRASLRIAIIHSYYISTMIDAPAFFGYLSRRDGKKRSQVLRLSVAGCCETPLTYHMFLQNGKLESEP